MELKKGYKRTEIGVIPDDWQVRKFTECADLKHGFQFREEHFSKNGIKVTKIGTLVDNGGLDFSDATYIPPENLNAFSRFTLKRGDILMALTGATLGKVSKVDTDEITLQNYRVGNFLNKENSTKDYIHCILQSSFIQKTIKKLVNEAAQPNLGKGDFDKFIIPLPSSKSEQTAIATALSNADALITSLEKLIAKKKLIKQGAMQELLKPKKGWVVKKLGEILESIQLGGNYPNTLTPNDKPLIKMGNLGRGSIDISTRLEYISGQVFEKDRLEFGDVLFNTRNTLDLVGKVAIWRNELPKAYFNSNIMRMKFKPSFVSSNFVMNNILNTKRTLSQLRSIATGTTSVAAIYTRDLVEIELQLPPVEEQKIIELSLNQMDDELLLLESKLLKLLRIKQGMMQNLLTGKIRLV